jgi:hypothetical protein
MLGTVAGKAGSGEKTSTLPVSFSSSCMKKTANLNWISHGEIDAV